MAHAIGPLAGYRRRADANLGLVWPDMPAPARRRLATRSLANTGRAVMENFNHAAFRARLAGTPLEGPGLTTLAEAQAAGRPILFASAHFGNYEAPRTVLQLHGHRVAMHYRPMSNPDFDRIYRPTLDAVGGPMFPQGRDGTLGFARHLRMGGWGILFYDLHQPRGDLLPFLGVPARTAISAGTLALLSGAALVPIFGVRQPDGIRFRCFVEEPIPPSTPFQMTAALNARLEAQIARHPEQWWWLHRRWKSHQKALRKGTPLT